MMRDMEMAKRADLMRVLDSAVILMEKGDYQAADTRMVYFLNNIKAVPTEFCFFFGKNSYHLGKYSQSTDWLNKYIQLKGTSGQFYGETLRWLDLAEKKLLEQRAAEKVQAKTGTVVKDSATLSSILSRNFDIDCGPSGKFTCPVCKGTTVIVKKGLLDDEYKNCTHCDKHGNIDCDTFNRLLRGELNQKK